MKGGTSSSSIQPVALGVTLQSSTYGSTIPVVYGRTKQSIYLIWSNNLRAGSSAKKGKKILSLGKKGGQPTYIQNVDFLLATNPIISVLQFWYNQNQQLPLVFTEYTVSIAAGAADSITVPDAKFYQIIAVTLDVDFTTDFADYGNPIPFPTSGWTTLIDTSDVNSLQTYEMQVGSAGKTYGVKVTLPCISLMWAWIVALIPNGTPQCVQKFGASTPSMGDFDTFSATFSSPNTPGNLIVVDVYFNTSFPLSKIFVSDNVGNNYVAVAGAEHVQGGAAYFATFVAFNGSASTLTITAQQTAPGFDFNGVSLGLHEYSGVNTGVGIFPAWTAMNPYSVDDVIQPTGTNWIQRVTHVTTPPGLSGSTEPTWPQVPGMATPFDGNIAWVCENLGAPVADAVSAVQLVASGSADLKIFTTVPNDLLHLAIGAWFACPATFGPLSITEQPLWNTALEGPDITDATGARMFPFNYYWAPGSGPTIDLPLLKLGVISGNFHIYYAQLATSGSSLYTKTQAGTAVPCAALRLTFEEQLGNNAGGNFDGFTSQQIQYPHYAGLGSPDLDLGSAQTIPSIVPETLGAFPLYNTGDADFADMIEDIFKGGGQAGFGGSEAYTEVQHGLGCFNFPGCVQKKVVSSSVPTGTGGSTIPLVQYDLPNTEGNFLIVVAHGDPSGSITISDTAGNTWTQAMTASGGSGTSVWYAVAKAAAAGNVVTFSSDIGFAVVLLEVAGVDTFDSVSAINDYNSADRTINNSVTATGTPTLPEYLLCINTWSLASGSTPQGLLSGSGSVPVLWEPCISLSFALTAMERTVYYPGTYGVQSIGPAAPQATASILFAFKCSTPPSYPQPLGNILDLPSLEQVRLQCRANGLWGSLCMDTQQNASDWLEGLYKAANAAAVWAGFKLLSIPYSEVSTAGNGAVYNAPTASGPVFNLIAEDMIAPANSPPVSVNRKAQVDVPNLLQIQHPNRQGEYNDIIVSQPESGSIALYGTRKASPDQMRMIQDPAVARMILGIQIRRQNYLRNTYKLKLQAKFGMLLPMDLISIPISSTMALPEEDPDTESVVADTPDPMIPLRVTSISEDDNYNLDIEAEPFIYGCSAPLSLAATAVTPYLPQTGASPGVVNAPIIFEPVARLCGAPPAQLWIVVSGSNPAYGGCVVYLSTDGGSSYNSIGTINGNAITGFTTGDWPAAADPDTTNNLPVDLTESLGELSSYQSSDRDNFLYPCYVQLGSANIPYELMSYNQATMTATYKYTLHATGSGNELRRAVFAAPTVGEGVDHPTGSRFAFLGPQGPGILRVTLDPTWVGKTLSFKFAAFNDLLGALANTTGLAAYTFVPAGIATGTTGGNTYTQTPPDALTNPTATSIHMAQVTVALSQLTVNYNARTFTITTPSVPTTYYVTIADPNYLGDTGSATTLIPTCQTSQALCGVPGNTYIGSIVAIPGGSGTVVTPGGWPPPQVFLVNGS